MGLSTFLRKDSLKLSNTEEIELMKIISEAKHIERVDREITKLYKSLSFSLWGYLAKKFIPPRTELQLEDPFLDGWRKVLEKRIQYKYPNKVFNWVFTIMLHNTTNAFNNVYEQLKLRNSDNATDSKTQDLIERTIGSNVPTVIQKMELEMIQKLIDDAIDNTLDIRERRAFKSYYYEELIQAEIAKNMEIALGSANKLIKSATEKIKYHLEKNGVELDIYVN